ncbi:MAG: hypothetical protein ABR920_13025 [Terriglobales bacterium]
MSTAAVSSLSILQELQSFYQNRQADLKQLGSALQSGDLNGAQQAYNALAALGQSGPFANSEPFSKSSRAQAFNAIGEALQAGDLAGAQAAFATLTGHQSNAASSAQATSAAVVNLSSTQSSNATATSSAPSIYQQLQAYRQQRQADLAQLGKDLQAGNLTAAQQDFTTLTALGQSGPYKNGQTFARADRAQDFQAIGQALQNGDLAGAQSAFASLAATFGRQNQQSQSAISAYNSNSGVTEIVINLAPQPTSTQTSPVQPPGIQLPIIVTPVAQPPAGPVAVPELVINLGGAASTSASSGSATPELVVNLEQGSSSSSGTSGVPEIVINQGGASSTSASSGSATPELVINLGQGSSSSATSSATPEEVTINLGSGSSGAQVSIDAAQGQNGSNAEQVTINLNQAKNYELILNLLNSNATSSSSNALSVSA